MVLNSFWAMAASLAFLGIIRALTIDNQLAVIKNDCYERMAIGQRLNPKDVYKSFDHNTVEACRAACTKEKTICKAFSFGIGPKGNATCELSADAIKETFDLKPIGTIAETDFDLYIKKMGCSLVVNPNTNKFPQNNQDHDLNQDENKPGSAYDRPLKPNDYDGHHKPTSHHDKPSGYGQDHFERPSKPVEEYRPSSSSNWPQDSLNSYDRPQDSLDSGYDRPQRPRPQSDSGYDRPQLSDNHPHYHIGSESPYGRPGPQQDYDRPFDRPPRPFDNRPPPPPPLHDGYDRPIRPQDDRPIRPLDMYDRPFVRPPHPQDVYDRPIRPPNDFPVRPLDGYDRPINRPPPQDPYEKPIRPPNHLPTRPLDGYDRPINRPPPHDPYEKPIRPVNDRPPRPHDDYDRPINRPPPQHDYHRPPPSLRPQDPYDRPQKPIPNYIDRPEDKPGYSYDQPSRPYGGGVEHAQTLVSIASGPNSYLHPVHDIIVGGNLYDKPNRPSYGSGANSLQENYKIPSRPRPYDDLPPFRPSSLNHPYNQDGPRPLDRYGETRPPRPYLPRPHPNDYDKTDLDRLDRFDTLPPPLRPYDFDRRYPSKYGSLIPHPDYYKRPWDDRDYMFRPDGYGLDPDRFDRPPPPPFRPSYEENRRPHPEPRPRPEYDNEPKPKPTLKPTSPSNHTEDKNSTITSKPAAPYKEDQKHSSSKPIVTHSIGYNGESITSIITELNERILRTAE